MKTENMPESFRYQLETVLGLLCQKQRPGLMPDFEAARKNDKKSANWSVLFFFLTMSIVMLGFLSIIPILGSIPISGRLHESDKYLIWVGGIGMLVVSVPMILCGLRWGNLSMAAQKGGWLTFKDASSLLFGAAETDGSVIIGIPSSPEELALRIEERILRNAEAIVEIESSRSLDKSTKDEYAAMRQLSRLAALLGLMDSEKRYLFPLGEQPDEALIKQYARDIYQKAFREAEQKRSSLVMA